MVMLSIINYIGLLSLPAMLFYEYMRANYPNETRHFIQQSVWFALKVETQLKISFNRTKRYLNNNIWKPLRSLIYPVNEEQHITFIKDGKEIAHMSHNDFFQTTEFPSYDFVIYNIDNNLIRYNDVNLLKQLGDDIQFVKSSVKFLTVEISIFSDAYDNQYDNQFTISFEEDNFYIENNILFDKPFIMWYLNKYHNFDIDINTAGGFSYTVNLIDNNINCITLTDDECIILTKDNYCL
jgi:hypothetical protein